MKTLLDKSICIQIHIRCSLVDKQNFAFSQDRSTFTESPQIRPTYASDGRVDDSFLSTAVASLLHSSLNRLRPKYSQVLVQLIPFLPRLVADIISYESYDMTHTILVIGMADEFMMGHKNV